MSRPWRRAEGQSSSALFTIPHDWGIEGVEDRSRRRCPPEADRGLGYPQISLIFPHEWGTKGVEETSSGGVRNGTYT